MDYLHSIEPIQKVYQTQCEPVLVRCNDWQYYVCKHSIHAPCDSLFNEFLAARFLNLWGIISLTPSMIEINADHLPPEFISGKLQPASLKHTLIGFPYLKNIKEVTLQENGFNENLSDRKRIVNREELIRIALFDLWLGNDDRNLNNYNLLLESKPEGFYFIPIDHETIFNTNSLHHGICIQTKEDSLIHTPLFKAIVSKRLIKNIFEQEKIIREDFYLCTIKCKNQLDKILEELPHDWNISIDNKRDLISKNIFSSKWNEDVFLNFLIYLKQLL
jgi:hypothetical protein